MRERIVEHFSIEEPAGEEILPRFNVAPTQAVSAVRLNGAGRRELVTLRWGLIPHWAKEPDTGYSTINARAETVAEKPAFRDSFRQRRCLIPSDGFYEWQPVGKRKQPWLIHLKNDDVFAFAGLWEHWAGRDGQVIESCTILVTAANELLTPIHDRMPVILDPAVYGTWLDVGHFDREGLEALLRPYPADLLAAYPVSLRVNNPRVDDEFCAEPVHAGVEGGAVSETGADRLPDRGANSAFPTRPSEPGAMRRPARAWARSPGGRRFATAASRVRRVLELRHFKNIGLVPQEHNSYFRNACRPIEAPVQRFQPDPPSLGPCAMDWKREWHRARSKLPVCFGPPPFPGTREIVPLTTPEALWSEGVEMRHCVASHAFDVAEGTESACVEEKKHLGPPLNHGRNPCQRAKPYRCASPR